MFQKIFRKERETMCFECCRDGVENMYTEHLTDMTSSIDIISVEECLMFGVRGIYSVSLETLNTGHQKLVIESDILFPTSTASPLFEGYLGVDRNFRTEIETSNPADIGRSINRVLSGSYEWGDTFIVALNNDGLVIRTIENDEIVETVPLDREVIILNRYVTEDHLPNYLIKHLFRTIYIFLSGNDNVRQNWVTVRSVDELLNLPENVYDNLTIEINKGEE